MYIYLSSNKKGYGIKELLSPNINEYWSSEAQLPHKINISFNSIEYVYSINLFLSFIKDESYTPEKILIFYNNKFKDFKFSEPEGFVEMVIDDHTSDIEVIIVANHTDGKDTHIRFIKIKKSPTEEIYPIN